MWSCASMASPEMPGWFVGPCPGIDPPPPPGPRRRHVLQAEKHARGQLHPVRHQSISAIALRAQHGGAGGNGGGIEQGEEQSLHSGPRFSRKSQVESLESKV